MSNKLITTHRLAALFAAAGLLAGCQQLPTAHAPQPPSAPAPNPGGTEAEPQRSPPAPPAPPATQQQATKIAAAAAVLLENGHEEPA